MKKHKIIIMASVLSASLLTACSSSSYSSSGEVMISETAAASGSMTGSSISSADSSSSSSFNAVHPPLANRKLIRTINLQIETTEFDSLLTQLTQQTEAFGGYIEQSDVSGSSVAAAHDVRRYASLTARIPSDHLDGFVDDISTKGNITNHSENTQDVTLQYSDIASHKKTLTVEQNRLWELLEKADSVDAVIALESRLSEIRYQLESLESQLRTYDNQVDYSTVYLEIDEVKVFTPTSPDSVLSRIQKGFQRSLENVRNTLVDCFVWFVSNIPTLILFVIAAGSAVLILRFFISHIKKKSVEKKKEKNADHAPTYSLPQKQQCKTDMSEEQKCQKNQEQ